MNFMFNLAEYYSAISIAVDPLVDPLGILRFVVLTNFNLVSDVNSILRIIQAQTSTFAFIRFCRFNEFRLGRCDSSRLSRQM